MLLIHDRIFIFYVLSEGEFLKYWLKWIRRVERYATLISFIMRLLIHNRIFIFYTFSDGELWNKWYCSQKYCILMCIGIFMNIFFRDEQSLQSGVTKLETETVAVFDDHNSLVWRVCWNLPGTILSSSGDDGCVRMFKSK